MAGSKKSGGSSKAKSGGAKKGGNTKKAQTKPSAGSKTESQKDPVNQFWSVILFAAGHTCLYGDSYKHGKIPANRSRKSNVGYRSYFALQFCGTDNVCRRSTGQQLY